MGFMRKIVHMLGGRELELPAAPTLAQRRRYTVVRRTLTIGLYTHGIMNGRMLLVITCCPFLSFSFQDTS